MKKTIAILFAVLLPLAALAADTTNITGTLYVFPNLTHSITSSISGSVASETMSRMVEDPITYGGTSANYKMNAWVWQVGNLTTGAPSATISLAAATNRFGEVAAITNLLWLAVKSATNNTEGIRVGNLAAHVGITSMTNAYTEVLPGGVFLYYAPRSGGLPCASTFVHLAITNDSSTNSLAIGYEVQVGGQQ